MADTVRTEGAAVVEARPPAAVATPGAGRRRLLLAPLLLAAGWALLMLTWAIANPPFVAPDEPDHYIRAIAVTSGTLGRESEVTIPPGLWAIWHDPLGVTCNAGRTTVSAACVADAETADFDSEVTTRAGAYPPLYYALPGLALRAAADPFTANRLGRLAAAALCLAFLGLALALLASSSAPALSLLGPVAAVTPMGLFVMASMNSSGLEVAAGIAFLAALLHVARPGRTPGWVWASAAAAGLALATVRATGALWVVLHVGVFLGLVGTRGVLALGRRSARVAAGAAALVALAVAGNRLWEHVHGSSVTQQAGLGHVETSAFLEWLRPAVVQIPRILDEQVGVFGWVDTRMPGVAYVAWQGMVAALLGVAFLVGTRRERWTLVAATVASLGVAMFLSATLQAAASGDVQGRHVLPFAIAVPLLAGEIVFRNRDRLGLVDTGGLFALFGALAAVVHLVAWHASAQRQSVGADGPLNFVAAAEWAPPGGWVPWAVVAAAGAMLVAAAGARRAREPA